MKFLLWCLCMTHSLVGIEIATRDHSGWVWVWVSAMIFYGIAGLVLCVVWAYRVSTSKQGAGARSPLWTRTAAAPAANKEE
jgi:hypothetical protein